MFACRQKGGGLARSHRVQQVAKPDRSSPTADSVRLETMRRNDRLEKGVTTSALATERSLEHGQPRCNFPVVRRSGVPDSRAKKKQNNHTEVGENWSFFIAKWGC